MTCEVVVMNKRGAALAADSAVTVSPQNKIYNTAEKLFPIAPDLPIAIMIYGSADLMDIPWETLIKMYSRKFAGNRFDTLEEHAANFLNYVSQQRVLFERARQMQYVQVSVWALWSFYRSRSLDASDDDRDSLSDIITSHSEDLAARCDPQVGADFGKRVLKEYSELIDDVRNDVFEGLKLSATINRGLRHAAELMFSAFPDDGGVIVAGMGEEDLVPVLVDYDIGGVVLDKFRYTTTDQPTRITPKMDACVAPFAQPEIIRMIIRGIHPDLRDSLNSLLPGSQKQSAFDRETESFKDRFMEAVAALPLQDLAKLAEALVNLTAFVKRMRIDEDETVAEPIDVAVLSKGDGFRWFRHKDLLQEAERRSL